MKHEDSIKQILYHDNKSKIISVRIIIFAVSILVMILLSMKTKNKLIISSEPQFNGRGVTASKKILT